MISKLLKVWEITNRINLEEKTLIQKQIEIITTNGKCYETVPYIKFLGEKIALKSWLKFSKKRFLYLCNYENQPTLLERNLGIMLRYISTIEKMAEKNFN